MQAVPSPSDTQVKDTSSAAAITNISYIAENVLPQVAVFLGGHGEAVAPLQKAVVTEHRGMGTGGRQMGEGFLPAPKPDAGGRHGFLSAAKPAAGGRHGFLPAAKPSMAAFTGFCQQRSQLQDGQGILTSIQRTCWLVHHTVCTVRCLDFPLAIGGVKNSTFLVIMRYCEILTPTSIVGGTLAYLDR